MSMCCEGEPQSFQEAMAHDHKEKWHETMNDDMRSLQDNHTYDLVKLPKGQRALKKQMGFQAQS